MTGSVLIVGCGVFGLSTALELAQKGYSVTAIDAYAVPSALSASNDFNKIIRYEYDDFMYSKMAVEAWRMWRTSPHFKDTYFECGRILITPELHQGRKEFERVSIENLAKLGEGLVIEYGKGGEDLGRRFKTLEYNTLEESTEFKWNPHCAYGQAADSLTAVYQEAASLGVKFLFGKKGNAIEIVTQNGVEYVKTEDGSLYTADKIIISSGAATGKLVDLNQQQSATGLFVTHIRLTEDEYARYRNLPIVFDSEMGYFFPPDPKTNIIKIALKGSGASNYVENPHRKGEKISLPRYKVHNPNDTIPEEGVAEAKKLLGKYVPELAYHTLFNSKACWIADTAASHFIIDDVPKYKKVMVATGDSGHGFKFLPNIGKYIVQKLENKLDSEVSKAWQWREVSEAFDPTKISWRVVSDALDFSQVKWLKERSKL